MGKTPIPPRMLTLRRSRTRRPGGSWKTGAGAAAGPRGAAGVGAGARLELGCEAPVVEDAGTSAADGAAASSSEADDPSTCAGRESSIDLLPPPFPFRGGPGEESPPPPPPAVLVLAVPNAVDPIEDSVVARARPTIAPAPASPSETVPRSGGEKDDSSLSSSSSSSLDEAPKSSSSSGVGVLVSTGKAGGSRSANRRADSGAGAAGAPPPAPVLSPPARSLGPTRAVLLGIWDWNGGCRGGSGGGGGWSNSGRRDLGWEAGGECTTTGGGGGRRGFGATEAAGPSGPCAGGGRARKSADGRTPVEGKAFGRPWSWSSRRPPGLLVAGARASSAIGAASPSAPCTPSDLILRLLRLPPTIVCVYPSGPGPAVRRLRF